MVADTCVKFGVQEKSGSPDTGSKGVKNGAFRLFLTKYRWCDPDFRAGIAFYSPWYVCKVWVNVWFRFSRYGVKGGQNGAFRLFLEKYRWGDPDFRAGIVFYISWYVCKVWCNFWIGFSRFRVKRGPKGSFSRASQKVCIRFQWFLGWKNIL